MTDKTALRHDLITHRRAIAPDLRAQMDAAIAAQVLAWWIKHPVETMAVYWPVRGEPDLRAIYGNLVTYGVQLALPVVTDNHMPLAFAAWKPGDTLIKDAFGGVIPDLPHTRIYPQALLIPCVGFNARRIRLGYGGGFYDRTLAISPRPFAIGVAYASALVQFKAEMHDIAMDTIFTETGDITGSMQ
jgi:5-formyltetrahydrofolate cyclo-ligase